jgi:hypothetical protein
MFPRSFIDNVFRLFFDDSGGGGSLGDVDDLSADLAVLNDDSDDKGDKKDDKSGKDDKDDDKDLEDDLKLLEDDDDDPDAKDDKKTRRKGAEDDDPDADDDVDDDADDDKDDDKDDKDDKDDDKVVEGRPSIKQIKAVAPDLFKKIPEMKNIFFREGKFSEIYADPEEAAEAARYAGNYLKLEKSIADEHDPTLLLKELKDNNADAFKAFSGNFLSKLRSLDENVYVEVTTPIIEELLYHANRVGNKTGDKNLAASARHLANFVFANGGEIPDIAKRAAEGTKKHPAEEKLEKERAEYAQTRFKEADQEVHGRIMKTLEASIIQGLDPDGVMSDRMKKAIVRDTVEELNALLLKDKMHGRRMQVAWDKGKSDSFSKQSKDQIVNNFLSGAKPLLRSIRNRIRDEVAGKSRSRRDVTDDKDNNNRGARKPEKKSFAGSNRPGNDRRHAGSVLDPSKIDYQRTSDLDILNDSGGDKIKLKGQR